MSVKESLSLQELAVLLRDRHSVRAYDPSVKISRDELQEMLELATSAPSSSNMQPWRFLVIDEEHLKRKLLPIANNQQQVVEASAVIAVLSDLRSYEKADEIYSKAVEAGYMTEEVKKAFVDRIHHYYGGAGDDGLHKINLHDTGLVSMQFMLIARAKGYDTVPMGGYNAEEFVKAFEIPDTLKPVVLIAVGKAAKPAHSTPRLDIEQITHWNSIKA